MTYRKKIMNNSNKIEQLLNDVFKDAQAFSDDASLVLTLNARKFNEAYFVFTRKENEPFCLMDCYFISIDNKFPTYKDKSLKFDIPMIYIENFIKKNLNDNLEHFLLKYPKNINVLSSNTYYKELVKKADKHQKMSSLFLPHILNIEMENQKNKNSKRIKI